MSRIAYYTRDSLLDCIMSQLFDNKGQRRSLRWIANSAKTIKMCRWKNDGGEKIGSLARAMKSNSITEMTLFETAKAKLMIPQHMDFATFSNNKKLNYEKPTEDSTLSKPIPKAKRLKELCYRLGIDDTEVDVTVMTEDEIYEFLKAIGFTQLEIDNTLLDIEKIKYLGR